MLIGLQIGMIVGGLVLLLRGRCGFGRWHFEGGAVRLAGFVMLLPWPIALLLPWPTAIGQVFLVRWGLADKGAPYRVEDALVEAAIVVVCGMVSFLLVESGFRG